MPNSKIKIKNEGLKVFVEVYEIVKKIPKGKVATYGQVAAFLNGHRRGNSGSFRKKISPRLVGFALHANRNPKVPCHRVVKKNGELAENYVFGGFMEQKRRLLQEEVSFIDKNRVDLSKHQCSL